MRLLPWIGIATLAIGIVAAGGCGENSSSYRRGSGSGSGAGDGGGPSECTGCDDDPGSPVLPSFGATVSASAAPPPISGGTLLVTHDGTTAVAADPDRDVVYLVDLAAGALRSTVALEPGDEPGRLVEDAAGRVHVALRSGGALVTIDPVAGLVTARRPVCPAPRGAAYDPTADAVWVACATGELVSLPAAGGAATTELVVERDLRDVVIDGGALAVTTFRSAEVLRLATDGSIARRDSLPSVDSKSVPHVAWRAIAGSGGTIVIVHQESSTRSIATDVPSAYGDGPSFVGSVLTVLGPDGSAQTSAALDGSVLPVDVALSPDQKHVAVVSAGNAFFPEQSVLYFKPGRAPDAELVLSGQATAVAFDPAGDMLVQVRQPASLYFVHPSDGKHHHIVLSDVSRDDTGHDIFHTRAGTPVACASCHPEGGDDGHVWKLDGKLRRTPSLRGTIAGTAPYHWTGDEPDLKALANDVYTMRMGGASLMHDQIAALEHWVEAIPAPPSPSWVDATAAARGQAIFTRADVGCALCHAGAKHTNNATIDVGTGGSFQVPPLVGVGWRTPLLHDGCAATIADRFGKCATPQHGSTSALSPDDVSDLGTYLETL